MERTIETERHDHMEKLECTNIRTQSLTFYTTSDVNFKFGNMYYTCQIQIEAHQIRDFYKLEYEVISCKLGQQW